MKLKRIAALAGIAILLGFYIAALVGAILGNLRLFTYAIYATFVVPALVFIVIMFANMARKGARIDDIKDEKATEELKEAEAKIASGNTDETKGA